MLPDKFAVVGKVAAVFFQNPSNFYKVLLIEIQSTTADYREKDIVVTGSFGDIQEEEIYQFTGELVDHPRYGVQFQVDSYQKEQPTSSAGVISYLSSDKFPGIGRKTAEAIVELFGEEAIDRLIEQPDLLEKLPKLNEKKRTMIIETLRLNHGMDQVIVGLSQYGFGSQLSFAIYKMYQNQALEVIEENPYQLVEDIEGVGFKKADLIAEKIGIEALANTRIRAAILHQITQSTVQSGDTYVPAKRLLEQTISLLETSRPYEIPTNQVVDVLIQLIEEDKLQQEDTNIYDNRLYYAEFGISSAIDRLMMRKKTINYPAETVDKVFRRVEKRLGIVYGDSQERAVKEAIQSPFFILTGGPGTGKTTVINGIVQMFAELNDVDLDPSKYTDEMFPILLTAPTGRAAKRMNETTGLPSGTIHRLLGLNGRDQADPTMEGKELEGGLLIVDEMSMVDTWLANTLLKAVSNNMQIILVGDKDQLPSVGPGQVLHDFLQIPFLPKIELTEIYRQGDGSSIIPLAHEIKNGRLPTDFTINQKDRSFFPCDTYQIEPMISKIVKRAQQKGFTAQDIQVLAPMYKGAAGIDALNKMMQEIFNPNDGSKKEVKFNETVYRIGDKVLQLVNSPEENVFNGDMGQIVGITYAKDSADKVDELTIQFDANEVIYRRNDWNKITLSYCCSIHKSQGSEFKMVILPMVPQYSRMLQRNLLYTAITRSKELLILLGDVTSYERCVTNESNLRLTTLKERILATNAAETTAETIHVTENVPSVGHEQIVEGIAEPSATYETSVMPDLLQKPTEVEPTNYQLTAKMVTAQQVDPMIGMNGRTPADFSTK